MEQLTTPKLIEADVVTPAENWFLYWKTSPSLWETKLREYPGPNPIFVPIYWALHSEYSDHYDFGQIKPETDLFKLIQVAQQVGRELVFLVQMSPVPFLINGGIPSYLARTISLNKQGLAISCLDNQQKINRLYTFYDPRVFQSYRKFVWNLGQYFKENKIENKIYGLDSYRIEDDFIVSYFMDHSSVFENGFARYLQQLSESEPEKIKQLEENALYSKTLKKDYSDLIGNLYHDAVSEVFGHKWNGVLKTCFIGGGSKDLFKRSQDNWEVEKSYFHPLMKAVVNGYYPTTLLLHHSIKNKSFGKLLKDLVSSAFVQAYLNNDYIEDELNLSFQPMVFFEVVDNGEDFFNLSQKIEDSGLIQFFKSQFAWSYKISRNKKIVIEEMSPQKMYFFFGERLDLSKLNSLIKLFLNGYKIFIDINGLDDKLRKRLDSFYTENSISIEKINYITNLDKASLGEGLILTYDSAKLKESSPIKRIGFWEKIMKYLEVKNLQIEADEDVEYFWKVRSSNTYELNYEEIRRVSFYNPSSYKRKARVVSASNFALIKSLDQVNAEAKSTPIGIDINLLPGGSVSLDFGYYEA
ncbi:MAG: hypothetical protein CME62_10585 [Halobacteriovoraceae bacterium]|nr:hypothetical protein [Halobacteriovoraceae bacterium]|tara:strand:- start:7009 stop:8754 length:1746 start_codon:yes stop_codon:yes gene_type:complete